MHVQRIFHTPSDDCGIARRQQRHVPAYGLVVVAVPLAREEEVPVDVVDVLPPPRHVVGHVHEGRLGVVKVFSGEEKRVFFCWGK